LLRHTANGHFMPYFPILKNSGLSKDSGSPPKSNQFLSGLWPNPL